MLKRKTIDLRVDGGIQENADEKQLDLPNMLVVENGYFHKEGKIVKRDQSSFASIGLTGGEHNLFVCRDALCGLRTDGSSFTFDTNNNDIRISEKNGIIPCEVRVVASGGGEESCYDHVSARSGQYVLKAWRRYNSQEQQGHVWYQMEDLNGAVVFGPFIMDEASPPQGYPKIIPMTSTEVDPEDNAPMFVLLAAASNINTDVAPVSGSTLKYKLITALGTNSSVTALQELESSADGGVAHAYDATVPPSGSQVAHIAKLRSNSGTPELRVYKITCTTNSLSFSKLNATPAAVVSTLDIVSIGDGGGDNIPIAVFQASNVNNIETFYVDDTFATIHVGDVVATDDVAFPGSTDVVPAGLSIAYTGLLEKEVSLFWTRANVKNTDGTTTTDSRTYVITEYRNMSDVCVMYDTFDEYPPLHNFVLSSRPFVHQGKVQISVNHTFYERGTFTVYPVALLMRTLDQYLNDIKSHVSETKHTWQVVARYNQGRAAMWRQGFASWVGDYIRPHPGPVMGYSAPPWITLYTNNYACASTVATQIGGGTVAVVKKARRLSGAQSGASGRDRTLGIVGKFAQTVFSAADVRLDMSPMPLRHVDVLNGEQIFSGGNPGVFDGWQSYEQTPHFAPSPPVVHVDRVAYPHDSYPVTGVYESGTDMSTDHDNRKYDGYFVAVYEWIDAFGNLHRSAPSLPSKLFRGVSIDDSDNVVAWVEKPPISSLTGSNSQKIVVAIYATDHESSNAGPYYEVARGELTEDTEYQNLGYIKFKMSYVPDTDVVMIVPSNYGRQLYTDGGELPCDPPTPMLSLCSDGSRLFGVSGEFPSEVRASKLLVPGISPEFSDDLYIRVPMEGGDCVAVEAMDDKIVVFKESAVYYFGSQGPNNAGIGEFGDVVLLTNETGARSGTAICKIPDGIMFLGDRGWYVLNRDTTLSYIGGAVERSMLDGFDRREVRFMVNHATRSHVIIGFQDRGKGLCYNYRANKWSTLVNEESSGLAAGGYEGRAACIWKHPLVAEPTLIRLSLTDDEGIIVDNPYTINDPGETFKLKLSTPWIKLAGLQGFKRIRRATFLGTLEVDDDQGGDVPAYGIAIVGYSNYRDLVPSWSKLWSGTEIYALNAGHTFQIQVHVPKQKVESIRFDIYETTDFSEAGFSLSGINLELGVYNTRFRHLRDGAKK